MNVGLEHYLVVSALLFCLGLLGVIMRRNLLVIYMSLELMLNAANLALVSFSRFNGRLNGQVMVFFIITVAAAEVAVGLALIVALYRSQRMAAREAGNTCDLAGGRRFASGLRPATRSPQPVDVARGH